MIKVYVDSVGTVTTLREVLEEASSNGSRALMVLACDENGYVPKAVDPLFQALKVPVFGGVFPAVINGNEKMRQGNIVVAFDRGIDVHWVPDLSASGADYEELLDEAASADGEIKTLMVFVDGMSRRISEFVDSLYTVFGLEMNYVGGGAGSLSFTMQPSLITNDGLKQDCAVVATMEAESGVGVTHGWTTVAGPFKVTESDRNVIKSLNWKPAFEVYREAVEAHSSKRFGSMPFFNIAKAYPFGIAKMGSERVVRDPLALDGEQGLVCVGEVPEGVYVDILHGDAFGLVAAAGQAQERALDDFPDAANAGLGLVMDCISRVLFLEDDFSKELDMINRAPVPLVGACTLGEIANSGKDYLEFYNKTSVVAFLED